MTSPHLTHISLAKNNTCSRFRFRLVRLQGGPDLLNAVSERAVRAVRAGPVGHELDTQGHLLLLLLARGSGRQSLSATVQSVKHKN
jgi:hypothetical protein